MIDKLTTIFYDIDNFTKNYKRQSLPASSGLCRGKPCRLALSEIATIYLFYHFSNFKNFKSYYLDFQKRYQAEFPNMVSYNRFIELIPKIIEILALFLLSKLSKSSNVNFIDSTKIQVCKNKRISRNKVFKGLAMIGKSSMGWFYGFKLHLIVNEHGELCAFSITKGNTSDVKAASKIFDFYTLKGKLFGDKGYISSELFNKLYDKGTKLITSIRSTMTNKLMELVDKIILRKRVIIETINDQLKNICDIEHSRHRSSMNFLANIFAALIAYTFRDKKPAIRGISYALIA